MPPRSDRADAAVVRAAFFHPRDGARLADRTYGPRLRLVPRSGLNKEKGPLAHPPEPGYPCYVSVLGELAWMASREEPPLV
jgi:hypothetical protein